MGSKAHPVEMVNGQVGSFVAEDFIDDRLGLIEKPSGESNAVLGQVGAPNRTSHPIAEPHLDLRSEFVKLP